MEWSQDGHAEVTAASWLGAERPPAKVARALSIGDLAMKYAGVRDPGSSAVTLHVKGWRKWSGNRLDKNTVIHLGNDSEVLLLARGMFGHEAGQDSPLDDDQGRAGEGG